jgi:metal-responsive CopG/Arc/MetJ family transcriptional regulator
MKKRLTLSLPVDVIKTVKEMAKARNMTASQFVEQVFRDFIAEYESQNNLKKVS